MTGFAFDVKQLLDERIEELLEGVGAWMAPAPVRVLAPSPDAG